jgi:molybdenum cofactor biosynthesis protein B
MAGIDETLAFHPLRVAVLTISDTRDEESDTSGALLVARLTGAGHALAARAMVADEAPAIRDKVSAWADDAAIDLILTTGGTGFAPRDVTPEAIRPLFRREMDGFSIAFHQASLGTVGVSTMQSRAFAGQIGDTFVFCLPGSNGACRDGWALIGPLIDSRHRPCSLAEQVPRLRHLFA